MITKKRTPAFPAYVCTKTTQEGDLILIGCKLVRHGRQMILRVWNGNPGYRSSMIYMRSSWHCRSSPFYLAQ